MYYSMYIFNNSFVHELSCVLPRALLCINSNVFLLLAPSRYTEGDFFNLNSPICSVCTIPSNGKCQTIFVMKQN